jgi:hypothetical protein
MRAAANDGRIAGPASPANYCTAAGEVMGQCTKSLRDSPLRGDLRRAQ